MTKWIHLQGLNPGLLAFFRRCFDCLRPGGRLILEPQPFSSYAKNVKALPELQERYDKLLEGAEKGWRPEDGDFERVLTELVGFGTRELLGETGRVGAFSFLLALVNILGTLSLTLSTLCRVQLPEAGRGVYEALIPTRGCVQPQAD